MNTFSGDGRALDCVCFNLRKATRSITHIYDAALRGSGLRATQFTVLNVIQRLGSAGVTRIAEVAVVDRTTLTRGLAVLERGGLVRTLASNDARERVYALTPPGTRALAKAHRHWTAAQDRVVELLGAARVQRLLGDLGEVVHVARNARRQAPRAERARGRQR